MPKINPDSNASAEGVEGVVVHATGKVSDLEPIVEHVETETEAAETGAEVVASTSKRAARR